MSTRTFRGARLVRFGAFELDLRAAELRKYGVRIRLQEQPFRILVMLLERPGEVVLRDEIRKRLWPNDTVVEVSHGINAAILRLREALGESAENPRYVETLSRRGYRFTGEVEVALKEDAGRPAPSTPAPPGLDTGELEGKTVSHFTVIEKLGGGGMGVVYRANDLTLGREVALKFLPRDLAGDAHALERFRREARAASALNHPNVCTVYGVEDCEGQPVIVMEMIEGETLAARLEKGPLPADEALRLAIQVASALDAAHRKSIVHRDLKPGNLLVTQSGVKVLDFGLAKMGRGTALRDASARNTAGGASLTQFGAVMGTLNYMSPEQVQGRETDARSDIYSFGLVLYEMLTGCRAVGGENQPPNLADRFAPEALERVVRRCLEHDPEKRWQSARDLKVALEWASEQRPRAKRPVRSGWIAGGVAAAVLLGLVLTAAQRYAESRKDWAKTPRTAAPVQPVNMEVVKNDGSSRKMVPVSIPAPLRTVLPNAEALTVHRFCLSPDGRNLALLSGSQLYIRSIETGVLRRVAASAAGTPFWSPDGKSLAFADGKLLKRVAVDGGEVGTICAVNTNIAGAWGEDGTILIGMVGDAIYRVPAIGGTPERVTELNTERGETRHLLPQFLPGGREFLYVAGALQANKSQLFAATLGTKGQAAIMPSTSNVAFVPQRRGMRTGYLLFVQDRVLMAQTFDAEKLHLTGEPKVLATGISGTPTVGAAVQTDDFSAAGDTLVYRPSAAGRAAPAAPLMVLRNWKEGLKKGI
jgi:DNA-binding winged helix-turn-helix (wHTH) protein